MPRQVLNCDEFAEPAMFSRAGVERKLLLLILFDAGVNDGDVANCVLFIAVASEESMRIRKMSCRVLAMGCLLIFQPHLYSFELAVPVLEEFLEFGIQGGGNEKNGLCKLLDSWLCEDACFAIATL